jgi:hypothetical protein
LFSRDDVAGFINKHFEPVWQSVRPVPIVRIDFGNGTVLTRTLHGNIATYACAADGQVLDVVAGIYAPEMYLNRLDQLRLLANYVDQQGTGRRTERLCSYHKGQLEALKKNTAPAVFINVADRAKKRIENGVLAALVPAPRPAKSATPVPVGTPALGAGGPGEDLTLWKALAQDTAANEAVRRRQVHERLSTGAVRAAQLTKWLYKNVLNADLDDPYLGLGSTLFASYPFKDEKPH